MFFSLVSLVVPENCNAWCLWSLLVRTIGVTRFVALLYQVYSVQRYDALLVALGSLPVLELGTWRARVMLSNGLRLCVCVRERESVCVRLCKVCRCAFGLACDMIHLIAYFPPFENCVEHIQAC